MKHDYLPKRDFKKEDHNYKVIKELNMDELKKAFDKVNSCLPCTCGLEDIYCHKHGVWKISEETMKPVRELLAIMESKK